MSSWMRRAQAALFLIAVVSMTTISAAPENSNLFQMVRPGVQLRFPRDHAAHPAYRTEWWYYTGQLRTQGADSSSDPAFGFELTFFRRGVARPDPPRRSAWALRDLYFAHFAITDLRGRRFLMAERTSRDALGLAGAGSARYRVWIDDWEAQMAPDGSHRLAAEEPGSHGIRLRLEPRKPPALHGDSGLSRKGMGEGEASYYVSITRLAAVGTVRMDGRDIPVTGEAWMDHEFTTGELNPQLVGWDWFGLQLDDQSDLMLYRLRRADGLPDSASSGSLVDEQGSVTPLTRSETEVEITRRWHSPKSGADYPAGWRIRVPGAGLELEVSSLLDDQELSTPGSTGVTYWEGAVRVRGTRRGVPIGGRGYVELTGYAEPFRVDM